MRRTTIGKFVMQEGSFIRDVLRKGYRSRQKRIDWLLIIALLLAALLLLTINLGSLPLRDGDEGAIAQVARHIWRTPLGSMDWLYQKVGNGTYDKKPPLMHLLVAWAYSLGGISEWTTRLPGAILTAFSVPLLYGIAREIFCQRRAAIYSALVYLMMLPVVRYGRLAMLDGSSVCFFLMMLWCLLRSRRDLRYCLGVGISLGLISLTQGIFAILPTVVMLVFLLWDTPRLLLSYRMWTGILIGILPPIFWYSAQYLDSGSTFAVLVTINQSLRRIWLVVDNQSGPPWYYLWEILKWTWPWLIFLPQSFLHVWHNRNLSWAKLILVWGGIYLLVISLMATKSPWYILPVYPSLALAVGAQLAYGSTSENSDSFTLLSAYPRIVAASFSILAMMASAALLYFTWGKNPATDLQLIFFAVAVTMALVAAKLERGDREFLMVLFWGSYISLLLLVSSQYWIWELQTAYSVKPVAAMIQNAKPSVAKIYTSFPYHRPSLDFYSDRTIVPASFGELRYYWQFGEPKPYFLLDNEALNDLQLQSAELIDQANGWNLVTRNTN
jgi:4-amino-4-deoxy-L-arabinose transferase-like glycosyltransferase